MRRDAPVRVGLEVRIPQPRDPAGITRFAGPLTEIVRSLREIDSARRLRASDKTWFVSDLRHDESDVIARLEDQHPDSGPGADDAILPVPICAVGCWQRIYVKTESRPFPSRAIGDAVAAAAGSCSPVGIPISLHSGGRRISG